MKGPPELVQAGRFKRLTFYGNKPGMVGHRCSGILLTTIAEFPDNPFMALMFFPTSRKPPSSASTSVAPCLMADARILRSAFNATDAKFFALIFFGILERRCLKIRAELRHASRSKSTISKSSCRMDRMFDQSFSSIPDKISETTTWHIINLEPASTSSEMQLVILEWLP